jgi:PAS domain S-box-containing protein
MKLTTRIALLGAVVLVTVVVLLALAQNNRAYMSQHLARVKHAQGQISQLSQLDAAFDEQAELHDDESGAAAAVRERLHELLSQLQRSATRVGELTDLFALQRIQLAVEREGRVRDAGAITDRMVRRRIAREERTISAAISALDGGSYAETVVAVLALLTLSLAMIFGVVTPLRRHFARLIATTRRIASGDLSTAIKHRGLGDLAALDRAIDVMRVQLREHVRNLTLSEQQHRALFDNNPTPIFVFDRESLVLRAVNEAMATLHGYTRNELLGMRVTDLVPDDARDLMAQKISEGGTGPIGIKAHVRKDGSTIYLDLTTHDIVISARQCVLVVGVDVTHARKVEDQLRQSQKLEAIGQLAGGVAHDFNNVLAVISMNAELIKSALPESDPVGDDVDEVAAAAQRGARLTRQLLEFSRQQPQNATSVELNAEVIELQKMLSRMIGEDIELSTVLAPSLPTVEADPGQLEQVIMNLVINARDAMPKGGKISIATSMTDLDATRARTLGCEPGPYVLLAVADTGTGMDEKTKARIFEPFFTTKEVGKGTGLGLANVFGIVKQSKGAIAVDSALGRGTTFNVYFPANRTAPTRHSHSELSLVAPSGAPRTVLVVEDNEHLRSSLVRLLEAQGFRCFQARNGDTALDFLANSTDAIDLMITDVVMPGMDGRALAASARALRPAVKVLLMSGFPDHPAVKTRSGEPYLQKPFTSTSLAQAIATAMAASAPERRRSAQLAITGYMSRS